VFLGSSKPVVGKASGIVRKPADEVFRFIGEEFFENYPKWSPEVKELKQLSDGPIGVGTMGRQVRVDCGRRSESDFKVTEFQPNRRATFAGVGRAGDSLGSGAFRCVYDLSDARLSTPCTRVVFTFEIPELEFFMRPFEKLIRVAIDEGAESTVRNIKRLLENG
jgi:hypothetical protein